jgi:hypothetical protein
MAADVCLSVLRQGFFRIDYLQLASRLSLPLLTLDRQMKKIAVKENIDLREV